jgi:hypothetical protein
VHRQRSTTTRAVGEVLAPALVLALEPKAREVSPVPVTLTAPRAQALHC